MALIRHIDDENLEFPVNSPGNPELRELESTVPLTKTKPRQMAETTMNVGRTVAGALDTATQFVGAPLDMAGQFMTGLALSPVAGLTGLGSLIGDAVQGNELDPVKAERRMTRVFEPFQSTNRFTPVLQEGIGKALDATTGRLGRAAGQEIVRSSVQDLGLRADDPAVLLSQTLMEENVKLLGNLALFKGVSKAARTGKTIHGKIVPKKAAAATEQFLSEMAEKLQAGAKLSERDVSVFQNLARGMSPRERYTVTARVRDLGSMDEVVKVYPPGHKHHGFAVHLAKLAEQSGLFQSTGGPTGTAGFGRPSGPVLTGPEAATGTAPPPPGPQPKPAGPKTETVSRAPLDEARAKLINKTTKKQRREVANQVALGAAQGLTPEQLRAAYPNPSGVAKHAFAHQLIEELELDMQAEAAAQAAAAQAPVEAPVVETPTQAPAPVAAPVTPPIVTEPVAPPSVIELGAPEVPAVVPRAPQVLEQARIAMKEFRAGGELTGEQIDYIQQLTPEEFAQIQAELIAEQPAPLANNLPKGTVAPEAPAPVVESAAAEPPIVESVTEEPPVRAPRARSPHAKARKELEAIGAEEMTKNGEVFWKWKDETGHVHRLPVIGKQGNVTVLKQIHDLQRKIESVKAMDTFATEQAARDAGLTLNARSFQDIVSAERFVQSAEARDGKSWELVRVADKFRPVIRQESTAKVLSDNDDQWFEKWLEDDEAAEIDLERVRVAAVELDEAAKEKETILAQRRQKEKEALAAALAGGKVDPTSKEARIAAMKRAYAAEMKRKAEIQALMDESESVDVMDDYVSLSELDDLGNVRDPRGEWSDSVDALDEAFGKVSKETKGIFRRLMEDEGGWIGDKAAHEKWKAKNGAKELANAERAFAAVKQKFKRLAKSLTTGLKAEYNNAFEIPEDAEELQSSVLRNTDNETRQIINELSKVGFELDETHRTFKDVVKDLATILKDETGSVGSDIGNEEVQRARRRLEGDLERVKRKMKQGLGKAARKQTAREKEKEYTVTLEQAIKGKEIPSATAHDVLNFSNAERIAGMREMKEKAMPGGMVERMKKAGIIIDDYRKGSFKMAERAYSGIPNQEVRIEDFDPAALNQKVVGIASPSNIFRNHLGPFTNPVVDSFLIRNTEFKNVTNQEKFMNDALKGFKNPAKAIKRELQPHYDKIEQMLRVQDRLRANLREVRKTAQEHWRQRKLNEERLDTLPETHPSYGQIQDDFALYGERLLKDKADKGALEKRIKAQDKVINDYIENELMPRMAKLAKEEPVVRATLAAGDRLPDGITLTETERALADRIRQAMEFQKIGLREAGITVKESEAFTPSITRAMYDNPVDKQHGYTPRIPDHLKFMHRAEDFQLLHLNPFEFWPESIRMAERMISKQTILNRWRRFFETEMPPDLRAYSNQWLQKSWFKDYESPTQKVVNSLINFEYMRVLFWSLSDAGTDVLKLIAGASGHSINANVRGAAKAAKVPLQLAAEKLGVKGQFDELAIARTYVHIDQIMKALEGSPLMTQGNKWITRGKTLSALPTILTDITASGINVLATLVDGTNAGLTYEQIHLLIMDEILRLNYRSGDDAPLWAKDKGRWLMMLNTQMSKQLELYTSTAKKAFKGTKDAYGRSHKSQLLKLVAGLGVLAAAFRLNDKDVMHWVLSIPFVDSPVTGKREAPYVETHGIKFKGNPLLDWADSMGNYGVLKGTVDHVTNTAANKYYDLFTGELEYDENRYASPLWRFLGIPNLDWSPDDPKPRKRPKTAAQIRADQRRADQRRRDRSFVERWTREGNKY